MPSAASTARGRRNGGRVVEQWQIFSALTALVAAWSLLILGVMRSIMSKGLCDLEKKINGLSDLSKDYQEVERSLLKLQADLPLSYVRKEDFVRFDVVINTKLDRLRDLIEALREKK
jgi:hypothetical protein